MILSQISLPLPGSFKTTSCLIMAQPTAVNLGFKIEAFSLLAIDYTPLIRDGEAVVIVI